jgi:hypothetical protein
MASFYYAKIYIEILDDSKMGMLSDRLWRRTVELILMAKEQDIGGYLPNLNDMAWRLHLNPEMLESDLTELAKIGIVQNLADGWHVTNFEKYQGPMDGAERKRRQRERERKQDYYDTDQLQDSHEVVTGRPTEKRREEKNRGKESRFKGEPPPLPSGHLAVPELLNVWGEWCEYHKGRGKPITKSTALRQFKEFNKLGPDASIAAMEYSMTNNYTGLVEPKPSANGRQKETPAERIARMEAREQ